VSNTEIDDFAATPAPMIIVWRVLEACNLACPFCAYDKRLQMPRRLVSPALLRDFLPILGAWKKESGRFTLLSWLGGEPTLWPLLDEMTHLARGEDVALSLTTNGSTLGSQSIRDLFLENYQEVTISLDGNADFHDAMRGWKGAFRKLEKSICALVSERNRTGSALKVKINTVLMHQNIRHFPDLCEQISDWGVDEITFNQLGGRDRPEFYAEHRLRPEDVLFLKSSLGKLRKSLSHTQVLGGNAYLARLMESAMDKPLNVKNCRVGDWFLFIDEAGEIAPCNFTLGDYRLKVSDLKSPYDFDQVASKLSAILACRPNSACSNCMSTQQNSKFAA
jgi:MoaA/NifB/PqqE/SkfB family radical SAM enzyme